MAPEDEDDQPVDNDWPGNTLEESNAGTWTDIIDSSINGPAVEEED